MNLTTEQRRIVESDFDLTVNAVAGSGKTTTIIEYARKRADKRILYLAYNRSVRQQAQQLFNINNLNHVAVETAHSLAYKYVVAGSNYKIRNSYQPSELVYILDIPVDNDELTHLKIAYHVWQLYIFYCNHAVKSISDVEYAKEVVEASARDFVKEHHDEVVGFASRLVAMMEEGRVDITHDYYLKKFQLMMPILPFDIILFDEGQDASPVMLDVFNNQPARRIIIGDSHQQIYGWRHAVNALDSNSFSHMSLSRSFRFGNDIARIARSVLSLKSLIMSAPRLALTGVDSNRQVESRAYIARTNASLLAKAIDLSVTSNKVKNFSFEGGISSYVFAQSGASLYDIINLYEGNRVLITNPLILSMPDFDTLLQYARLTGDVSLKVLADLVRRYEGSLSGYVERLKQNCKSRDDANGDEMVFATVHKSKGMEYDEVFLANDFITEQALLDRMPAVKGGLIHRNTLAEEVNMLYVAVTRTRVKLHIPTSLIPVGVDTGKGGGVTTNMTFRESVSASVNDVWTKLDDVELRHLYVSGKPIRQIALLLNRTSQAVESRVEKLRLWDKF